MPLDRRQLVTLGAAAGTALASGCSDAPAWNLLARRLESRPADVRLPRGDAVEPAARLLNRLGCGWRPGELDEVRAKGIDAHIEEQLAYEAIDDAPCSIRAARFETIESSPGDIFEYRKQVVERELFQHTMLRAVYSRRQLYETMVRFWTDHFNISLGKGDCAWFKTVDDRAVIRPHAMGNFGDLLRASALSPAMLVYLDGKDNQEASGADGPNENYARELLELHALGVHGGYTQRDVMEAARCLTGWTIDASWFRGRVAFRGDRHDGGEKRVLGQVIPAGLGDADLDRLLDIVIRHPATPRYIAAKLCRKFVGDAPPPELIERAAESFRASDYAIRPMVRTILASDAFRDPRASPSHQRLKRPFRFVASALRALDADTDGGDRLREWLQRMGHAPFNYPTPDGYPDEPGPWLGSLLWRWNFAIELASNGIPGTRVDLAGVARLWRADASSDPSGDWAAHVLGRRMAPDEAEAMRLLAANPSQSADRGATHDHDAPLAAALALASPAFQKY
ncbi:MAG: DUF1800 domain-containing protein [Planctomycetes bacterium]|nr:DUF1800 domain-containing protein [Planctomycetota bacterium]